MPIRRAPPAIAVRSDIQDGRSARCVCNGWGSLCSLAVPLRASKSHGRLRLCFLDTTPCTKCALPSCLLHDSSDRRLNGTATLEMHVCVDLLRFCTWRGRPCIMQNLCHIAHNNMTVILCMRHSTAVKGDTSSCSL